MDKLHLAITVLCVLFCAGCTSTKASHNCLNINDCQKAIYKKVYNNFEYSGGLDDNIRATIKVQLDDNAFVNNILVVNSSGNKDFDEIAKLAVTKSSPFIELKGLKSNDYQEFRIIYFHFIPNI